MINDQMIYGYAVDEKGNFLFETHKYGLYWWKDQIKSSILKLKTFIKQSTFIYN